ncbi:MAG TPA: DUF1549 domain-containing protein [Paludibaculum sp.]
MASLVGSLALLAHAQELADLPPASGQNCTYLVAPDETLNRAAQARSEAYERTIAFSRALGKSRSAGSAVAPQEMPVRSFIDEEIFRRLEAEGLSSAAICTDEEFIRRVTLDLTGRIPSAADIVAFTADAAADKRDALIDRLLNSPEFNDKWAVWLGDLLQNAQTAQNRNQGQEGRNRLFEYIKDAIATSKPWRDIAWEMVTATGNNYDRATAGTNFLLRGLAPMGPAQDTYDLTMVKAATAFLGLSHYDCLSCHNGKFHLDQVSAWGAKATRLEAQRMSAHFARTSIQGYPGNDATNFYTNSTNIVERANGFYTLNTNYGNRPNRVPQVINGVTTTNLTPMYRDGTAAAGDWRASFAQGMIRDPMFARNYANRLWKAMFNLALAEPVDGLDPARLDPSVQPPAGWAYQASHPLLLEKLATFVRDNDYNLRETLRFLASSTAYQLSSRYDGDWNITQAPLFARHIPRRLEAEEVHDAITKSTALMPAYTVGGYTEKVSWAMQLPEPVEPRSDGTANGFMNSFTRGNRDTLQRSQSGSILMWLNMMNSSVVNNRVRATGATASPYLVRMAANKDNAAVVDDMFLTFISRSPTEYERGVAMKFLTRANSNRNTNVEDLAWALINKTEFLFSY